MCRNFSSGKLIKQANMTNNRTRCIIIIHVVFFQKKHTKTNPSNFDLRECKQIINTHRTVSNPTVICSGLSHLISLSLHELTFYLRHRMVKSNVIAVDFYERNKFNTQLRTIKSRVYIFVHCRPTTAKTQRDK